MSTTPAHDPTYLGALETGWEEGYSAGYSRAMRRMSDEPGVPDAENPYTRMCVDRRHYIEEQVRETYTIIDEDGRDVFEYAEFIDAILDAHADWLAAADAAERGES